MAPSSSLLLDPRLGLRDAGPEASDLLEQGSSSRSALPAPPSAARGQAPGRAWPTAPGLAPTSPLDPPRSLDPITGLAQRPSPGPWPAAGFSPSLSGPAAAWVASAGGSASANPAHPGQGVELPAPKAEPGPAASPPLSSFLDTDFYYATGTLSSTGSVSTTSVAPAPVSITGNGTNIAFQLSWDASVGAAPSGFQSTIAATAQRIADSLSSVSPVTINLQIGWGSVNNAALPSGALGASSTYLYSYGTGNSAYSYFRSRLASTSSGSVIDKAELAKAVPTSNPLSSSSGILFTSAQGKAIGAISGSQSSLDGFIGFADTNYLQTSGSGYDLSGVSMHEITESMGRIMNQGASGYSTTLDLLHYTTSANGTPQRMTAKSGYLSADGINKLGYLNTQSSGDAADWASPTASRPNLGADSCNAFASPGALSLSNNDWFAMDALGWNLAAGSGLNTSSVPAYLT